MTFRSFEAVNKYFDEKTAPLYKEIQKLNAEADRALIGVVHDSNDFPNVMRNLDIWNELKFIEDIVDKNNSIEMHLKYLPGDIYDTENLNNYTNQVGEIVLELTPDYKILNIIIVKAIFCAEMFEDVVDWSLCPISKDECKGLCEPKTIIYDYITDRIGELSNYGNSITTHYLSTAEQTDHPKFAEYVKQVKMIRSYLFDKPIAD